ncbi:hypothetical protein LPJ55_000819 [Coemansia sp. RSA 990]|nr:hypothetical protein LPJ68_000391 [Coemansia sp. RSA 1086]KAJ1753477.1 hypothetical protein LPJ79_000336 [Coemansia sp. RSA 1821]KAJ1875290.1 hypothetical protein LPJ55_000819 [Coemansia sp. RSA 990]
MDRTESLATASYNSRSQFEREKERLITEINQGMDTVNKNLIQLNQNLESAISLSTNFDRIAQLWNEFGLIINPPAEEDVEMEDVADSDSEASRGNWNDDNESTNAASLTPSRSKSAHAAPTVMDEDE